MATSKWETESTGIVLQIDGENYKISLKAHYTSKVLGVLEDQAKDQQNADDL